MTDAQKEIERLCTATTGGGDVLSYAMTKRQIAAAAMRWAYADAEKTIEEYKWWHDHDIQDPTGHQLACSEEIARRAKEQLP